jgi:uncharacterized membrane protein
VADTATDWRLACKQLLALVVTLPPVVALVLSPQPGYDLLTGALSGLLLAVLTWIFGVRWGLFGDPERANHFVGR